MAEHYTDEEAEIVSKFAWEIRDGIGIGYDGHCSLNGARRLLDAVAPAIAARPLRDGQEHHEREAIMADTTTARTMHRVIADAFRARADEIEGKQ